MAPLHDLGALPSLSLKETSNMSTDSRNKTLNDNDQDITDNTRANRSSGDNVYVASGSNSSTVKIPLNEAIESTPTEGMNEMPKDGKHLSMQNARVTESVEAEVVVKGVFPPASIEELNYAAREPSHENDLDESENVEGRVKTRSSSNGSRSTSTTSSSVRFDKIEILEFPRDLGDNPSVRSGAPIALARQCSYRETLSVEEYESTKTKRLSRDELLLDNLDRMDLLKEFGFGRNEIKEAAKEAAHAREARDKTAEKFFKKQARIKLLSCFGRKFLPSSNSSSNIVRSMAGTAA